MAEGYQWREQRQWELAAWVTAHLLNVSGKVVRSRITAKKLLGHGPRPQQALEADFEKLWKRVEQERGNGGSQ